MFLQRTIESVLKEILKTVSYQYISFNEDNGQYYIDIKKDIAVDELIEQRAETLDNSALDIYYFNVLEKVVDCSETTYVTGYKIWYYEIPWNECKVTREGYLFFGAPNERSTAQPPRDFYIYILQPYEPSHFKDEHKQDEIFIRLKKKDEKFDRFLKLYAGAKEMSNIAPSGTKNLYEAKAAEYFKLLSDWIRNNFTKVYEVTYKGKKSPVLTVAKNIPPYADIREIINAIASTCFNGYLCDKYPDYPHFSKLLTPLTHANMKDYIVEAYQYLNGKKTRMGMALLDGFVLLHDDKIKVHKSGYAKWVIDKLENLKPGQVINRSDLIDTIYTKIGTKDVELTKKFKIEPELFSVILIALVYNGDIVLTVAGTQYDAMKFEQLIRLPIDDIVNFSHIKKPSGLPMPALNALFDFLEIQPLYLKQDFLVIGVKQLYEKSSDYAVKIARAEYEVNEGIKYWNGAFLTESEKERYKSEISALKGFMESLQKFNTPAKLQNFKYSVEEVNDYKEKLKKLYKLNIMKDKIKEINEIVLYLKHAQTNMADDTELVIRVDDALNNILDNIRKDKDISDSINALKKLKSKYIDMYINMHNRVRLNASEDDGKQKLLYDKRINALRQLKEIDILPGNKCDEFIDKITRMKTCWNLTKEKLERFPICPDCNFRPKEEKIVKSFNLEEMEEELDNLLETWTGTLINTFKDPKIKANIELLTKEQKVMISTLIKNKKFKLPIDIGLIEAIKELLHGIEKIEITIDELKNVMGNGNPLTLNDVKERFDSFINNKMSSMDEHNTRFVLKQETDE